MEILGGLSQPWQFGWVISWDSPRVAIFLSPVLEWAESTEKSGINLVADEKESQDLDIRYVNHPCSRTIFDM